MNMQDIKNGLACDATQELLIKRGFESLAEEEVFALAEHLQHCEPCAAFHRNLVNITKFTRVSPSENLVPDPAIRVYIRNQFIPSPQTVGGLSKIWHSVFAALNNKIPAYQAVLGMAVVAVMFLAFGKLRARDDGEIAKRTQMTQTATHVLAPATAINHIAEIDSQKIGRTVADDSLLMKFMVTASSESI